jgi:hypothetical protein
MFPSRFSNALSGLLELADAMLAPAEDDSTQWAQRRLDPAESQRQNMADSLPALTGPLSPHPHRRPLASTRRRRLTPPATPQICVSPVVHRRADAPREHATR